MYRRFTIAIPLPHRQAYHQLIYSSLSRQHLPPDSFFCLLPSCRIHQIHPPIVYLHQIPLPVHRHTIAAHSSSPPAYFFSIPPPNLSSGSSQVVIFIKFILSLFISTRFLHWFTHVPLSHRLADHQLICSSPSHHLVPPNSCTSSSPASVPPPPSSLVHCHHHTATVPPPPHHLYLDVQSCLATCPS